MLYDMLYDNAPTWCSQHPRCEVPGVRQRHKVAPGGRVVTGPPHSIHITHSSDNQCTGTRCWHHTQCCHTSVACGGGGAAAQAQVTQEQEVLRQVGGVCQNASYQGHRGKLPAPHPALTRRCCKYCCRCKCSSRGRGDAQAGVMRQAGGACGQGSCHRHPCHSRQ